jgi:hypothetical protein
MFDKDYKNAMDRVNIDEQKRDEILDKIILKEELKDRKNPALPWRVAFACVACAALVLGVLFVPTKSTVKKKVTTKKPSVTIASYGDVLMVSKSYDEIYELIKPDDNYAVYDGTDADDMLVYEEEYIIEDAETSPSAKPGAINGNSSASDIKGEITNDTNSSDNGKDFSNTTEQVEGVTEGAISVKAMNTCMSVGVAVAVGLAMMRVITGISLMWIVIPGYVIALGLSFFVPKLFVGIAFDSGGVASGPMTSTFLLPLSIGGCEAVGGNVMTDAFGVVALVALTPLIAIQLMGLVYQLKTGKVQKQIEQVIVPDDIDEIIDLEE